METNKFIWCGSPEHLITACPRRLKAIEKGTAKPLAPPCQGTLSPRPTAVGRAYVMSKKEASTSSVIVTETLFLNQKSFCILFLFLVATHSFIFTICLAIKP